MEVVRHLFGSVGVIHASLLTELTQEISGCTYRITDRDEFSKLDPREKSKVYWTEMLYRAHWAAASNLTRHHRWFTGCLRLYEPQPNFIAFSSCLRGLIEAAADAYYSLQSVALTLAQHHGAIQACLEEKSEQWVRSKELEDVLIHYQFARKLASPEAKPETHRAKYASIYIEAADAPNGQLKALYNETCQIVHPAAQSLRWMAYEDGDSIRLATDADKVWIEKLCFEHAPAIQASLMQSVNHSLMILKVLNFFPIKAVHTKSVDNLNLDNVPGWRKIKAAYTANAVTGPSEKNGGTLR